MMVGSNKVHEPRFLINVFQQKPSGLYEGLNTLRRQSGGQESLGELRGMRDAFVTMVRKRLICSKKPPQPRNHEQATAPWWRYLTMAEPNQDRKRRACLSLAQEASSWMPPQHPLRAARTHSCQGRRRRSTYRVLEMDGRRIQSQMKRHG